MAIIAAAVITRKVNQDKGTADDRTGRSSIKSTVASLVQWAYDDKIADRGGISDPLTPVCCRHFYFIFTQMRLFHLLASLAGDDQRLVPNSEPAGFYASLIQQ
jgi:hypothetical protein